MLRLLFSLLPLALLLGCPTAAPVTTEEPQCPRPVDASPAPSGAEVFAKDVFVTWDDVPEDPSLLVLIDGAELAGTVTTEDEGRTLRWTPETPLPPVTQVDVAAAQSCADEVAFGFTTGRWGLPLDDSEALPDATFHLDIGSGSVVAPEGVGPIVQALLREDTLLLSVLPGSDLDGGPVHVRAAKSTRDGTAIIQEPCAPTQLLTAGPDGQVETEDDQPAVWEEPRLSVANAELALVVDGEAVRLRDASLSVLLHPALDGFVDGTLDAQVDVRELQPLVLGETPDLLCEEAEAIGEPCLPCADGAVFCLDLVLEDLRAISLPDVSLIDRDAAEIADDPECP